jgi:hypothetical protein
MKQFSGKNFLKANEQNYDHDLQSIIQPHIDYCFLIICMTNVGEMRSLQLLQNRAMRIILKKARKTHIRWMQDVLDFHSIN